MFGGDAKVTQIAVRRQLRCGKVVDIRTGMDLTKEEAIRSLYKYVKMACPLFILGGPPCSAFGALSKINSWKHPATYAQTLKTGMACARVMATISRMQAKAGRWFVVENPYQSELFKLPEMRKLKRDFNVGDVSFPQCAVGLTNLSLIHI